MNNPQQQQQQQHVESVLFPEENSSSSNSTNNNNNNSVNFDPENAPQSPQETKLSFFPSSYGSQQQQQQNQQQQNQQQTSNPFFSDLSQPNVLNPDDDDNDEELPLLEELGIDFKHILKKTKNILNPFITTDVEMADDKDLAGPLFFALALGFALLLRGKVHFGYIYGAGIVGCVSVCLLMNLMSQTHNVDMSQTVSALGYGLLPMVILALISIVIPSTWIVPLVIVTAAVIFWSSYSAVTQFVASLQMTNQRFLIAYPIGLVYTIFALITMF